MFRLQMRVTSLAAAFILALAGQTYAAITRIAGPTTLVNENRGFVRFDSAFDTTNRVSLVVWGTQLTGPVNGLFLNEAGVPIGGIFALSAGAQQSGWARVIYSPQQGKFLVSYTKIMGVNQHQKLARFVTYTGGTASMSAEIILDAWTGHAGTESGLAYSVPAQRFLVTWWRYSGQYPVSFVAALDASGTALGTWPMTNPGDGQSDPEIACDPANRRCLAVGWSWGTFNGGGTALWGRYIDDTTGAPLGSDSFYLPAGGYLEEPTITFSEAGNRFLVAYTSNGQIWGNTVTASGTVSASYPVLHSTAASVGQDGGGYGFPTLVYNTSTQTVLLSTTPWLGFPAAQEIDSAGLPIAGALDFVPDPGGNYDLRNKYTIPVANPASRQFLLLDNHLWIQLRVSVYSTTGSATPPPVPRGGDVQILPFNYNGDALNDVLLYNRTTGSWTLQVANLQGKFEAGPSGMWVPGLRIYRADWNGNGLEDLFGYSPTTGAWSKINNSGTSFTYFSQQWQPNFNVYIVDLNGDQRTDVFLYDQQTGAWYTAISSGDGTAGFDYGGGGWLPGFSISPGDFDGDGRTDFLLYNASSGAFYKAITRGNGRFQYSGGGWSAGWTPIVARLNGDGLADVFLYHATTGVWYRALSVGDGTGGFIYTGGGWSAGWTVSTANFNGDILTDFLLYNPNTGSWYKAIGADGAFSYTGGGWSPGWETAVTRLDGDIIDDVLLFNSGTGLWYRAITTPTAFNYTTGTFVQ